MIAWIRHRQRVKRVREADIAMTKLLNFLLYLEKERDFYKAKSGSISSEMLFDKLYKILEEVQ